MVPTTPRNRHEPQPPAQFPQRVICEAVDGEKGISRQEWRIAWLSRCLGHSPSGRPSGNDLDFDLIVPMSGLRAGRGRGYSRLSLAPQCGPQKSP